MKMHEVNSSNLKAIGWEGNTLRVEFKTGTLYDYNPVVEDHFKNMIQINAAGESVGKYFTQHIRNNQYLSFKRVVQEEVLILTPEQPQRIDNILSGKGVVKLPEDK